MGGLLVLGSKPDPALPPPEAFDELACANGSGASAARLGLPPPALTVMSAVLTSGLASGRHSIAALAGLETRDLYFLPRPPPQGRLRKRLRRRWQARRMRPEVLARELRRVSFRWSHWVYWDRETLRGRLREVCGDAPEVLAAAERKQPSTGVMALVLGLSLGRWDRYILSGFSFELTHAYGENPDIRERGTTASRHAETDTRIMSHLAQRHGKVFTTEPTVCQRAGVPLLAAALYSRTREEARESR